MDVEKGGEDARQRIISTLKDLVRRGEVDRALQKSISLSAALDSDLNHDLSLLSARYARWKRRDSLGLRQDEFEWNEINHALLELINHLDGVLVDKKAHLQSNRPADYSLKWIEALDKDESKDFNLPELHRWLFAVGGIIIGLIFLQTYPWIPFLFLIMILFETFRLLDRKIAWAVEVLLIFVILISLIHLSVFGPVIQLLETRFTQLEATDPNHDNPIFSTTTVAWGIYFLIILLGMSALYRLFENFKLKYYSNEFD